MSERLYQPWIPMNDPTDLKVIGKLGEEAAELCAAVSRCIIQGVDEKEPVTGKVNRQWLLEEIADVMANMGHVVERFNLDRKAIGERVDFKHERLKAWHKMTTDATT